MQLSLLEESASDAPAPDLQHRLPYSLSFHVLGTPAPQGSKRYVGNGIMVESSNKVKPWRSAVANAGYEAMDGREMMEGPLRMRVTFSLIRPGSISPKKRPYPSVAPDLDKLLRSTFDALSGVAWRDDAQVVEVSARKLYGTPGAHIEVGPL